MKITETIEGMVCDVCDDAQLWGAVQTTGWLIVETFNFGIVSDTRQVRHLCNTCRQDFDQFWGE